MTRQYRIRQQMGVEPFMITLLFIGGCWSLPVLHPIYSATSLSKIALISTTPIAHSYCSTHAILALRLPPSYAGQSGNGAHTMWASL